MQNTKYKMQNTKYKAALRTIELPTLHVSQVKYRNVQATFCQE